MRDQSMHSLVLSTIVLSLYTPCIHPVVSNLVTVEIKLKLFQVIVIVVDDFKMENL